MSVFSSRNVRYPRCQDTDLLQLCIYHCGKVNIIYVCYCGKVNNLAVARLIDDKDCQGLLWEEYNLLLSISVTST